MSKKKHHEKPIFVVMYEKEDRPELKWKGYGKVPSYALPSTKEFPHIGVIPVKITNPYRKFLEKAYLLSHRKEVKFSGFITRINGNNILFRKVSFTVNNETYKEKHVWIMNIPTEKMPKHTKRKRAISFYGKIYLYKRKDGTLDYGIENFAESEE